MDTTYTFYGHATHALRLGETLLLIDPFFTGNPATTAKAEDMSPDYILITHGHSDHVGDAIEIAKRSAALCISNSEISDWLNAQGIKAHPQHIGGGFHYPFGYLKLTLALHGSQLPDGSYGGNPAGFLLTTLDKKKIYFAGDTGLFGDMALIGEEGIDLAILPIGDNFTMGPDDALRAVKLLKPKIVVPTHYNTFPLINQDADAWKERVEAETDSKVLVMKPGESLSL